MGSIRTPITGGGSPGDPDTSVQYNDGGVFAGDSTFTFDDVLKILTLENLQLNNSAVIEGNLTVNGSIVSINSTSLNIGDNHIYLNAADTSTSPTTGGIVVNIGTTGLADTVTSGAFTAGVVATSNPTVITDGSATFAANDIVQLSSFTQNNGIFEVLSHTGTTLTIRGVGNTATVEDWTNNQFVTETDTGVIDKVNVTVLLANDAGDGRWGHATGNTTSVGTPFDFDNFMQGPEVTTNLQFPLFDGTTGDLLTTHDTTRLIAKGSTDNFVTLLPAFNNVQGISAVRIRDFADTADVFLLAYLPNVSLTGGVISYNTEAMDAVFKSDTFFEFNAAAEDSVFRIDNDAGGHRTTLKTGSPVGSFSSTHSGDFYKNVTTGDWFKADAAISTAWSTILTSSDGVVIGPGSGTTANEVALYLDTTGEAIDFNASVLITSGTNQGFNLKANAADITVNALSVNNSVSVSMFLLTVDTDNELVKLDASGTDMEIIGDLMKIEARNDAINIETNVAPTAHHIAEFTNTGGSLNINVNSGTPIGVVTPDALGEFLLDSSGGEWYKANGTAANTNWDRIIDSGDGVVIGPGSSVDNELALFDGTTGELIKGGTPYTVSTDGNIFSSTVLSSITNEGSAGLLLQSFPTGENSSNFDNQSVIHLDNARLDLKSVVGDGAGGIDETVSIEIDPTNSSSQILITDETGLRGALYAADYSASFEARSLVDKGYVDSEIDAATTDNSANTQVIVNEDGTLTGDANFTWADDTLRLQIGVDGSAQSQVFTIPRAGTTGAGASFPATGAAIHVKGTEAISADFYLDSKSNTASEAGRVFFRRARDSDLVIDDNFLGIIEFQGNDGVNGYIDSARITGEIDGTAAANDMPGRLAFWTTTSGTTLTEKMRITAAGLVGINTETPASLLDVNGSFAVRRVASGAGNVSTADEVIIGVTDTAAARTVTIQTADIVAGRMFIIKDESGAAGTNNITVATQAAETIDGQASVDIIADYGVLRLYSDGSNLFAW